MVKIIDYVLKKQRKIKLRILDGNIGKVLFIGLNRLCFFNSLYYNCFVERRRKFALRREKRNESNK